MATLAPSLAQLRNEINKAYPHRDKTSDGWIGDPAHASRVSDHNPDANGIVHALDVDVDDGDPLKDLRSILVKAAIAHPATNYVISNGRIYSRAYGFASRVYTGTNGHYHHVHVSILHTKEAEQSTRPWGITRSPYPILRYGSKGPRVLAYTTALKKRGYKTTDTDLYQSPTVLATKRLQADHGWRASGVAYYKEQHVLGLSTP